jgi:eukaryotic-like serine/threonine-protein kinase
MALATGSLLAGRYEITDAIATGGMGEVWQARDRVLDRIVAAKVLRSEYTGDPSFLARFRNEARHTAALSHPNIASVYDYGETTDETGTQKLAFLVMEFVDGQPLVTILHDEGRLPVDWTLHVLKQSGEGLSAAHRAGVVHRDIKPGNLIVRPDGVVKLTDFGIAQARDATPLTKTGMVVGTAQYLSPEQAQGMEVTSASDVYSLGVVAYECLAGVRPFDGASQVAIALAHINRPPPPLPDDVPPAVRLLVDRALAKDPADRFPDGGAFAEAVARIAAGGALAAPVTGAHAAPTTAPQAAAPVSEGRTQVLPITGPRSAALPVAGTDPGRPMPPLHAADDDDLGPAGPPPDDRRRRTWWWVALAALLVLLVAGGAWALATQDDDPGTTGSDPGTSASAGPSASTLAFDPASYIGRNVEDVSIELQQAEMEVTVEVADPTQLAAAGVALDARDVAAVDPAQAGTLEPGDDVVLYYAEQAYAPPVDAPETTPSTPPSTTAAEETTSAAPSTSASRPTTPATTSESSTSSATSSSSTAATSTSAEGSSAVSSSSAPPPPPEGDGDGDGDGDGGGGGGGGDGEAGVAPDGGGAVG